MIAVLLNVLASLAAPPTIPPQFSSNIVKVAPFTMGQRDAGIFVYDSPQRGLKVFQSGIVGLAPKEWDGTPEAWSNFTQWTVGNNTYFGSGGQIKKSPAVVTFEDMFGWLSNSVYSGTTIVNNKTATVWELSTQTSFFQYCTSSDGKPLRTVRNIFQSLLPGMPPTWANVSIDFMTFEPVAPPSEFSDLNTTAALYPPACPPPEDPTPVVLDMYIFHPSGENNISGQDTADAIGDAAFVCLDVLSNNTKNDNYSVVSLYSVEVYPQFGQYKQCNHYEPSYCIGAEPILVGREGGLGYGEFLGQCTPNTLTGSWFSLLPAGQCANGTRPTSPDVCTWRIVEKVKTIDVKCLFQRGMLDACKADRRLPFPKTTNIFVTAFEQDDPSKGGCPPYQE